MTFIKISLAVHHAMLLLCTINLLLRYRQNSSCVSSFPSWQNITLRSSFEAWPSAPLPSPPKANGIPEKVPPGAGDRGRGLVCRSPRDREAALAGLMDLLSDGRRHPPAQAIRHDYRRGGRDRPERVSKADPTLVTGQGDLRFVYPQRAARLKQPIEVCGGVRLEQAQAGREVARQEHVAYDHDHRDADIAEEVVLVRRGEHDSHSRIVSGRRNFLDSNVVSHLTE